MHVFVLYTLMFVYIIPMLFFRSHNFSFLDYRTKVIQMTPDLIEVEWTAFEDGIYEIHLDQDVPGSYSMLDVSCNVTTNPTCSTYFIKLPPNSYEATVTKCSNGTRNSVARTITTTKDVEERKLILFHNFL